jgi:hypothetical protein
MTMRTTNQLAAPARTTIDDSALYDPPYSTQSRLHQHHLPVVRNYTTLSPVCQSPQTFFFLDVTAHPSFLRKQESIWEACIDRNPYGFLLSQE